MTGFGLVAHPIKAMKKNKGRISEMNSRILGQSDVLRDLGPYSSRYTSKGSLLAEAGIVINGLFKGMTIEEARERSLDGSLLNQRTHASRLKIWKDLHYRLFTHRIDWMIEGLKEARAKGSQSPEFVSMVYINYALRDHLTYDIVTGLIWNRWQQNQLEINREDILSLLDEVGEVQHQVYRWAESSRLKLASNILTSLRDFGILEGAQRKRIVRPILPLFTAEHLLRILTSEGFRGGEVLKHFTWRLFLCSEEDVASILASLSQVNRINFEKVGNTVVLHTPDSWEDEK